MANRGSVPKFGTWDSDSVGYTVYFEKVRENKGATAPPLLDRPSNPSEPEESAPRMITAPSRPATSSGHRSQQQHHRRAESSSSAASDPAGPGRGHHNHHHHHHHRGSRGPEQSKFAPPPQYYQRAHHQSSHHSPGGHHGGNHHHPQVAAPRSRAASPHHNNTPAGRQRPSAAVVPRFGVWDEQSTADAALGFTVMFDNLKRHRQVARGSFPNIPRPPSPESEAARRARHTPLVSKMFGCFTPHGSQ